MHKISYKFQKEERKAKKAVLKISGRGRIMNNNNGNLLLQTTLSHEIML